MVVPLSYISIQPVLHDWCNKGCGMCGMVHIKDQLALTVQSKLLAATAGFVSRYVSVPLPYVQSK